jgi:predicted rRNA methylase YqxC with S4 and FtsJ domains
VIERYPELGDPETEIRAGHVWVDGFPVRNPESRVSTRASIVWQLERVSFADDAELIALVKPMFELGLAAPPPDEKLPDALARAVAGAQSAGWTVVASVRSPVTGARGAIEFLLHARRA